jgi:hypothetical protein
MRIPLIIVNDKQGGGKHIVGTDVHDHLYLTSMGIAYENYHNGEGTAFGGDYEFSELEKDEYGEETMVKFVTPGEYINKIIEMQADRIRELQIICNDCALKNIPLNPKKETLW